MQHNRRKFLKLASSGVLATIVPTVEVKANSTSAITRRKLILLTLIGGCDTLNMFIPNGNKAEAKKYKQLRKSLAITSGTLPLKGTFYSLHPKMTSLQKIWNDGHLALFPATHSGDNSNTSHFFQFNFFDRGAYGDMGVSGNHDGWLARYLNSENKVDDGLYAYNFTTSRNMFKNAKTTVFGSSSAYRLNIGVKNSVLDTIRELTRKKSREGKEKELENVQNEMVQKVYRLKGLNMTNLTNAGFRALPETAKRMKNAIEMLRGIEEMDVVQIGMGGYDTHTDQLKRHNSLFEELNKAIEVFRTELHDDEFNNILFLVQTEFSRTLDVNGAIGTDHGKAATWFAMGGSVKKGIYGKNIHTCLIGKKNNDENSMDDIKVSQTGRSYFNEKNDYRDVLAEALDWIGAKDPGYAFDTGVGTPYEYTKKIDYLT